MIVIFTDKINFPWAACSTMIRKNVDHQIDQTLVTSLRNSLGLTSVQTLNHWAWSLLGANCFGSNPRVAFPEPYSQRSVSDQSGMRRYIPGLMFQPSARDTSPRPTPRVKLCGYFSRALMQDKVSDQSSMRRNTPEPMFQPNARDTSSRLQMFQPEAGDT